MLIGGGYYYQYEYVPAQQRRSDEAEQRVGSRFKDCGECPEMVVVPSGTFTMGSPSSEEGRGYDEDPRHRVTIDYPLAVGCV